MKFCMRKNQNNQKNEKMQRGLIDFFIRKHLTRQRKSKLNNSTV